MLNGASTACYKKNCTKTKAAKKGQAAGVQTMPKNKNNFKQQL
jgi:hypothetical protein